MILATTDAVCPQDGTGSASSAIITTPESALVAVDSARSWFEINSASGSLHARVAGTLYVRGANCNGSGCPIAIDRITLETAEPAVFKRKHGDPIQIVRPYVIQCRAAEGLTSSFIAGNPSGFEFSIAKNALHLWASGAVDGKRQLVNARNAERVGNGRIMHDGELAFDGDVKVAGITLRVHLAGHIRSWPPYVRSITYTWDSAGTLSVLVEATAVSKSAVTATLIVNGDTRFVLPIGKPFVARGVNKGDKLATYVCADGHCVLRPHLLERKR